MYPIEKANAANALADQMCRQVVAQERSVEESIELQIASLRAEIERLERVKVMLRKGDLLHLSAEDFRRLCRF